MFKINEEIRDKLKTDLQTEKERVFNELWDEEFTREWPQVLKTKGHRTKLKDNEFINFIELKEGLKNLVFYILIIG